MPDFPNSPALNDLFTSGWSTWMWDGVKWMASVPSGGVYEPVFGGTQYPMYGFLYNKTVGDPGYSAWAGFGAHRWRFGTNPGDEQDAGAIDYRGYVSDALSIVGAGATAGTRKINLYDNVNVSGNLTVGTTTILGGGGGIVSVGNITATGPLAISGPIGTTGSSAILTFQDRTGTTNWGWYAQAGVARLWNDQSGDRFTVDSGGSINTPGNVRASGNLYLGGAYVFFSGVTAGGPFIFGGTTDFATQLGTGNGAFKWYSNPGAQLMSLTGAGNLTIAGTITPNSGVIELGNDRTSDGYAYVDFHAQAGTDYDFRIIRNPGANGGASIVQNGSAPLTFAAPSFSFNNPINSQRIWIQGVSGNDSLVIYRSGATAYFTFIPEYAANQALIGYYVPGTGWGSVNFPGPIYLGAVTVNGGTDLNGYLNVNNGNNLGVSGSVAAYGGQIVCYNSNVNGFYVANANGHFMRMYDDGQGHIEASSGSIYIGYTNGVSAYFGGGVNCADLFSRANLNCAGSVGGSGNYLYLSGWGNGNVNSTGGPFLYMDGNWIIPHLGPGNAGFAIQNTNGSNLFQIDSAGGLLCYGNLQGNSTFNFNGTGSFQNTIYTNYICMNNGTLVQGRDTNGTPQWVIGLWSDNQIYVGDTTRDVHIRGYTTYCDNSNEFRCNNAIHAVGSNAMLYFDDRTDGIVWGWYAHNSVVHLYSNLDGDRVAIDRGGNISTGGIFTAWDVHANSGLFCNGLLWQNNGGWWWTGSPIHSDSEMTCSALNFGGCRLANVSGYAYFDQTTHAAGHYSRGDIWCAGSMTSGNHLQANGGGWCIEAPNGGIYCPNEVHGGYVTSGGNVYAGNDITANSVFRGTGNGGARIGNWQGSGWDWMAFAIISGGYLGVSPDQGASGFNYTPNASWSDARLKLNIRASEIDALAVIGAIPVRAFDWTEKGRELMPRDVSSVSCGLVAQELEELIPDAVTLVPVIGDLAGDPMRCIIHEQLDAYYIRAFQQLTARIEELENLVLNPSERNLA